MVFNAGPDVYENLVNLDPAEDGTVDDDLLWPHDSLKQR